MGRSIGSRDWRELALLAGEVGELAPGDLDAALDHALDRLRALLGGDRCFAVVACRPPGPVPGDHPLWGWEPRHVVHRGLPLELEAAVQGWWAREARHRQDAHTRGMTAGHGATRVHLRAELVDDRSWPGTPAGGVARDLGMDDRLVGARPGNRGTEIYVGFDRALGDPRRFGPRERALLETALGALAPLVRRLALAYGPHADGRRLSPREREVLGHLARGLSEKEIADRMALTVGSLHQYVRALFRKTGVRSRAELLAVWMGSRPQR